MERMVEFFRMILYLLVAIVIYLGVGQFLILTGSIEPDSGINLDMFREALALGNDINEKNVSHVHIIDDYLHSKNSPMAGTGEKYVEVAQKYNLPVYLMVAMAGAESGFGKMGYASTGTYNPVGLGVHEGRVYSSWEESIEDTGYVLRNYYFDEGREDPIAIQNKWAPRCVDGNSCQNSWAQNVSFFVSEIEEYENEIS